MLLNLAAQIDFVLPSQIGPDGAPLPGAVVWKLRCLTASERGALEDTMMDFSQSKVTQAPDGTARVDMGMAFSMSERRLNRVRLGVVGWEGLTDHDSTPVEYIGEGFVLGSKRFVGAPSSVVQALPDDVLKALSKKVADLSGVSATAGNF
jgi:hypothetical protein